MGHPVLFTMHLTSNVETQKNLYEILGIDSNADDNAIKKAYRKKVLTCHPDKNPNIPPNESAELFHELTKAYSVLTDIEARKAYDEFLAQILANQRQYENRPTSPQQYEFDFSKWSSADYESFKRHQFERQKSTYSNNESKNNPNESNDEEPEPETHPVKPERRRGRKYTPLEKFWYKLNFKRRLANEHDAEAANQHQSNRPISRKCQWTFLIVFLVQGLACCCLFPLL